MTRLSFLSCLFVCIVICINGSTQGFINSTFQYQIQHSIIDAYNGSGLSCADFNQDGLDDLTLCSRNSPVKFYINQGGTFQLDTLIDHQGEVKGAIWADIENDNDEDLLITTYEGYCRLYINLGSLELIDVSEEYGIPQDTNAMSYGASFGDFNRDGYLDLYICNYNWPTGITNWLLTNDGTGHFINISETSPASDLSRRSFQSTFLDFNNDLWSDLFVINDKQTRNSLYLNNNGSFEDVTESTNSGDLMESMSNSPCDFDHDGDLDIYISNGPIGNVFLRNDNGVFVDIAPELGMTVGTLCWGALWIDYNADGWEDLYVCDIFPYLGDVNRWFRNNGNGTFSSVIPQGMNADNYKSYANAIGDFNNDTKPDIVVVNDAGQYAVLWENYSPNSNYIAFDISGVFSNTNGVGAWMHVYSNGLTQHKYSLSGENYLAQNSSTHFFGLDQNTQADSIIVEWPSGWIDRFYDVQANIKYHFIEGTSASHELSLLENVTMCEGDSIYINSNFDINTVWNDGFVGAQRWIHQAGTYFATAELLPNWFVESNEVTIEIAPPITYSVNATNIDCFGNNSGIIQVLTDEPFLVWENESSEFMVDSLPPGNYSFEITNIYGCQIQDSVSIEEPLELILSSSFNDPFNGQNGWIELTVQGGTEPYIYNWNVPGNSNSIQDVQQGTYTCTVIDANGCEVMFENTFIDLGNSELQALSLLRWNSQLLLLEVPFNSHGMLRIFDSKGALVLEQKVNSNDTIDLSELTNGVYSISFLKSNVDSFETMTVVINK
jgi:hypothetical protein